jgi:nucleotide-binding universal stress UspA family protein
MIGLKRVLVPTDFSETSDAALTYGIALAGAFGATLHVLHVVNQPMHEAWAGYAPGASFLSIIEHMEADARQHIEALVPKEDLAVGRVVAATVWGDASDQILEYALAHHIDLIICGTHGRRGWDHLVMGSVAETLVRKATCPVLTVRHPEHEFVLPDAPIERERATA